MSKFDPDFDYIVPGIDLHSIFNAAVRIDTAFSVTADDRWRIAKVIQRALDKAIPVAKPVATSTYTVQFRVTFPAGSKVLADSEARRLYAGIVELVAEQHDPSTTVVAHVL